jgi:hypothetical protein
MECWTFPANVANISGPTDLFLNDFLHLGPKTRAMVGGFDEPGPALFILGLPSPNPKPVWRAKGGLALMTLHMRNWPIGACRPSFNA